LRVVARVENAEHRLRPGLFARVEIGVAVRDGVAMIPEQSILQRSDGSVAFVVRDGTRAERRNVKLGAFRDGLVEVTSGIAIGEQVIVRGSSQLVDGAVVDPRNLDGTPSIRAVAEEPMTAPAVAGEPTPVRSIP
jgi:multidrug efflux pump subunit AcrA (membrane-fusion protein)